MLKNSPLAEPMIIQDLRPRGRSLVNSGVNYLAG